MEPRKKTSTPIHYMFIILLLCAVAFALCTIDACAQLQRIQTSIDVRICQNFCNQNCGTVQYRITLYTGALLHVKSCINIDLRHSFLVTLIHLLKHLSVCNPISFSISNRRSLSLLDRSKIWFLWNSDTYAYHFNIFRLILSLHVHVWVLVHF